MFRRKKKLRTYDPVVRRTFPSNQGYVGNSINDTIKYIARTKQYIEELKEDTSDYSILVPITTAYIGGVIALTKGLRNGDVLEISAGTTALTGLAVSMPFTIGKRKINQKRRKHTRYKIGVLESDIKKATKNLEKLKRFRHDVMLFDGPEEHLGKLREKLGEGFKEFSDMQLPIYGHKHWPQHNYYHHIKSGRVLVNGKPFKKWSKKLQEFARNKYAICSIEETKLDDFD